MGGGCCYSAELGGVHIWELEKHFDYPVENKYRPKVRMLNSGICVGDAGLLVEVCEYARVGSIIHRLIWMSIWLVIMG